MPLALFAWILLGAANSGLDFKAAINIPFYAVAFLNGCLSILFAGLLKFAASENEHTERMIAFYTLVMLGVCREPARCPACVLPLVGTARGS